MSTIHLTIFIIFLISTSLALVPPRAVYSAVIYNADDSSVQCNIYWSSPKHDHLTSGMFTVNQGKYHLIKENIVKMDTWEARAIIKKIQCGNLVLNAPFDKVNSPQLNWEFRVESNQIVSVGPSSYTASDD